MLFARGASSPALPPMVSVGKLSAGQARYYLDQAAKFVDRPSVWSDR